MMVFLKAFLLVLMLGFGQTTSPPVLLVSTIFSEPFVMGGKDPDTPRFFFKGILIDMLKYFLDNGIAKGAEVKFNLQSDYGAKQSNGTWNGVIGDVANHFTTAFGLADLTVTSEALDVVQFSLPYLSTGVAAAYGKGIDFPISHENLPKLVKMAQAGNVTFGCLKGDLSETLFRRTDIQIYKDIYTQMKKHDENFVKSIEDGFAKIRNASSDKPFVYFGEKAILDYHAGKKPCDVKVSDCETLISLEYALCFRKGADITFYNKAISDYLASGKMQVSKQKWYKNECHSN